MRMVGVMWMANTTEQRLCPYSSCSTAEAPLVRVSSPDSAAVKISVHRCPQHDEVSVHRVTVTQIRISQNYCKTFIRVSRSELILALQVANRPKALIIVESKQKLFNEVNTTSKCN
jgi:hypothetical protein